MECVATASGSLCAEENVVATLQERKALMRKAARASVQAIHTDVLQQLSRDACHRLLVLDAVREARGVAAYLSMPAELQTATLLEGLFQERYEAGGAPQEGRRAVFVPKVTGGNRFDMVMVPVNGGSEEVASYPKSRWLIPEPELPSGLTCADLWQLAVPLLDVVVVPGVAFDDKCRRLGRGKGYYDTFLESLASCRHAQGLERPVTVGICFDEQVVADVPVDQHDRILDFVVTPSTTFRNTG